MHFYSPCDNEEQKYFFRMTQVRSLQTTTLQMSTANRYFEYPSPCHFVRRHDQARSIEVGAEFIHVGAASSTLEPPCQRVAQSSNRATTSPDPKITSTRTVHSPQPTATDAIKSANTLRSTLPKDKQFRQRRRRPHRTRRGGV